MPEPMFSGLVPQGTILPDTTYYAEDHPQREELLTLWKESTANLLKAYDFSDEEIEDLLEKRLELDRRSRRQSYFQTKKVQNMPNSTIHMLMKISKICTCPTFDDFFQAVIGQATR